MAKLPLKKVKEVKETAREETNKGLVLINKNS